MDWDDFDDEPAEVYDEIVECFTNSNGSSLLKQFGKGLAVTLGIATIKYTANEIERLEFVEEDDRRVLKRGNKR